MGERRCEVCGQALSGFRRAQIRTCSDRCRKAASRQGVPAELRALPRWTRHVRKRPVQLDGSPASSTDPGTWCGYRQVRGFRDRGFMLGAGICCIDVDHATEGWARDLAERSGSYVELSPSGQGLHIWGFGVLPRGGRFRWCGHRVEAYDQARFMTVTGRRFCGPRRLVDLRAVIAELV